ncbi:TonB-dependent receptor plug domain-containing protein [Pelagicoccus sp. NFK12]|uniref:TonB-dependent receptor plug domain-containing protein n=2 Tax=Pelagicoccus TaxID=455433 RepID=A0A927IJ91_9BACT|nr:TonB-dependent receptor plug domain-containing protein [Pelagicoccus enzymogenes]MBD5781619.1 TonB-dependent receptor plug domain-containing protein [Pelagicoccus enzymogenes]
MMTLKTKLRKLGKYILPPFVAASSLVAQDNEDSDVFELSPFTVDAGDEAGYRATSTLAGSRLNMRLKDVGSAISVMTKELMNDVGATDAGTLLSYGLNTEVASGDQGNFSNSIRSNGSYSSQETRRNPQSGQRIRGLAEATLTRDYFLTDIPFDGYNTESVTISRGPNSLLFGIGSPGGVINNAIKSASIGSDFGELGIRLGERGSYRTTIDYNKTLLEDRLAVRVSLLEGDTQFQQRPAYEEVSRRFVALNATLAKNEGVAWLGAINLRASVEDGLIMGTPPDNIPMLDGVSSWFGLPDNLDDILEMTGAAPRPYVANYQPKWTVQNHTGAVTSQPGPSTGGFWEQYPVVYNSVNATEPGVGFPDAPEVDGVLARVQWGLSDGDPGYGRSDNYYTWSYYGGATTPGFQSPNIINPNIYDNRRTLIAGNSQWVRQEFDVVNVRLEQAFLENKAGIEIAYNAENYSKNEHVPFYNRPLIADVMETLSNGKPNPNVGRPLIMDLGSDDRNVDHTARRAYQATAFYKLELEGDGIKRFLGNHTFTGFVGSQEIDLTRREFRNVLLDLSDETNIESDLKDKIDSWRRRNPIVVYVGPSMLDPSIQSLDDVKLDGYWKGAIPEPGDILTQQYQTWVPTWKGDEFTDDLFLQADYRVGEFLREGARSRREIDSEVFSVQSDWLAGHVISVLGWRTDEMTDTTRVRREDYNLINPQTNNYHFQDGVMDEGSLILSQNPDDISTQSGDTFTASIVAHVPKEWLKLPYSSQLSLHYNESENFSASGVRRNVLGEIIPSPTGTTEEYGFSVSALEDRLSVKFNWFETSNKYSDGPSTDTPGWIQHSMDRWRDAETQGMSFADAMAMNTQLTGIDVSDQFSGYQDVYDEALSMLPLKIRNRFQGWNENGAGKYGVWTPNPGQSSSQDFVSKGFEVDVAGQLTDNWTMAFNLAKQETVISNVAPVGAAAILSIADNLAASPLGSMIDSPNLAEDMTWTERWTSNRVNSILAALASEGKVSPEQRKWRANLVTNYSFSDGFLKDFQVGGALRWQDRIATGYRIAVEDGRVTPLLDQPFYGDDELNGDVWVKYGKPIFKDRIDWHVQINVRNFYRSNSDFIPMITNPDGRDVVFRNPNPTEMFLTNTFRF